MKPANKKNFIYGLIPAKLNSKSIHQKNLQKIKKKSLIEITIDQTKKTKKIDKIFVSSESDKIKKICKKKKLFFLKETNNFPHLRH